MLCYFDFKVNLDDKQINYTLALKVCAVLKGMLYCALARYDSYKNSLPFSIPLDINKLKKKGYPFSSYYKGHNFITKGILFLSNDVLNIVDWKGYLLSSYFLTTGLTKKVTLMKTTAYSHCWRSWNCTFPIMWRCGCWCGTFTGLLIMIFYIFFNML